MDVVQREQRLKELRADWRRWNRAWPDVDLHFDYCLLPCGENCGACEGCNAAAYRADRCAEIKAEAKRIKGAFKATAAKPEMAALF